MTDPTQQNPSCFGLLWEAVGESPCMACVVKAACLDTFVRVRLPQLREALGSDHPPMDQLAVEAGRVGGKPLCLDAVEVVLAYESKLAEAGTGKIGDAWDAADPEPGSPTTSATPAEPEPRPEPETHLVDKPKSQEESVAVKKKAPVKKKPAKKTVRAAKTGDGKSKSKKKVAKKKKKKAVAHPPKAGPAKSVKAPASKKKKKNRVLVAKAQVSDAAKISRQYQHRWETERARNPKFAKATPGTRLRREYQGKIHEVMVGRGYYEWEGNRYPTLGEVTKAITGTKEYKAQREKAGNEKSRPKGKRQLSNWSASRFWRAAFSNR